jgi:hypothetical protein
MSATVLKYPTAAADNGGGAGLWTSTGNVFVSDAVYASGDLTTGAKATNYLKTTAYGFAIPSTATIDGILVEFQRYGTGAQTGNVALIQAGTVAAASVKAGTDVWPGSEAWQSYGGPTDLWGVLWAPSDINNSGFGAAVLATDTGGPTGTAFIDAVRITVYWHGTDVPKRYLYQVYDYLGTYLGLLPNVISEFASSQEINTAGAQINIEVGVSVDTAIQPVDTLTDESGNTLTDESSSTLTTEGQTPIISPGGGVTAFINNGNMVKIYEISYWNPNGKCLFLGTMQRWEAAFGGQGGEDKVTILCYSDGNDLDNYLMRANPYTLTTDVSQTSQNASVTISQGTQAPGDNGFNFWGQTWTPGGGVTNLAGISVLLNGAAFVTIYAYDGPELNNLLGSVVKPVIVTSATEVQFQFPNPITLTPGATYFFVVAVSPGNSITLYYSSTGPYASGSLYNANGSGSIDSAAYLLQTGDDLYFKTFSGTGSTKGTFTSLDPTTGMLETFMTDYAVRGGLITYTSSTIQATGLSLTAGYNTNTILEGIKQVLTLCPNGFYWYVDLGTDVLYMQQTNDSADVVFTKGLHLDAISIVASIVDLVNTAYFSGGLVSGSNIYVSYSDADSLGLYGPHLDRPSNLNITDTNTAHQAAVADVEPNKDEKYQTTVTVVDKTMDTTLLKPGMVVGFNGFGTWIDDLLVQIVRVDYGPEEVALTLGALPKRMHPEFDKALRSLNALNTVDNPSAPS